MTVGDAAGILLGLLEVGEQASGIPREGLAGSGQADAVPRATQQWRTHIFLQQLQLSAQAGWARGIRRAADEIAPSSTTVRKYFNCLKSIHPWSADISSNNSMERAKKYYFLYVKHGTKMKSVLHNHPAAMTHHIDPRFFDTIHAELTSLRHDLHRHPELGFQEHATARRIAAELERLELPFETGIGQTGIVATVHGQNADNGRRIGCAPTWTLCRSRS